MVTIKRLANISWEFKKLKKVPRWFHNIQLKFSKNSFQNAYNLKERISNGKGTAKASLKLMSGSE